MGPFTDGAQTFANLALYGAFLATLARSGGGGGPTAPVKNTPPTVVFPGGSGDAGEIPVLTMTTPFTGTTTTIDLQILYNGVVDQTIPGATTGMNLPAVKSSVAPRAYQVIALGNWTGGQAVPNASVIYTLNAPAVPVVATAPSITPANATELTTLVPVRGAYTVAGAAVANSTLTFTQRWTSDWTLTAALTAATSATLAAPWLGTTGSYTVIFSDGSTKTTTLTNGSAAFSWTGAVTATSALKVQLSTLATLALNTNNIGQAVRYYETPTGSGGAGAESQASNTVTPTDSTAGGGGGLAPGHLFLQTIPNTGAKSWATYQARRALFPLSPGMTSRDAQALVASIPTSGGVTLAAGATGAQIQAALNSNSIVFLSAGTYTLTSGILQVPANTWLIGVAGQVVNLDCAGVTHGLRVLTSGNAINLNILNTQIIGLWLNGDSQFTQKISVRHTGLNTTNGVACLGSGNSSVEVQNEYLYTSGGGDGDGRDLGQGGGNHQLVNCIAGWNDDDGFDTWGAASSCFLHFCETYNNGRNTDPLALSGDGNGFKLGTGAVKHFLDQPLSQNNKSFGFNYNGSSVAHDIYNPSASGNLNGTYANPNGAPASQPDPAAYNVIIDSGGGAVPAVEYLGRFDVSGNPRFSWSGTTIKARFNGTSVSVDLASVFANNYSVSIDGGAPVIYSQGDTTPRTTISLATGLAAGNHTVQLTRNNSWFDGATTFYGFTFGGGSGLLAPAAYASPLRLEVYGDSISAGGGINSAACGSVTDSENAYLNYAHVATRTMGAQPPTLIAASGHGIFHGYNLNSGVNTVPGVYDKTLYGENLTWAFPSASAPNVVLIALGTNDPSNCPDLGRDPTNAELQAAYANFAVTLRAKYPTAKIALTVGPMNFLYQTAALAAVAQRNAAGDANVYSLIHSTQTLTGCVGHPAIAQHAVMATELVTFLGGLGYGSPAVRIDASSPARVNTVASGSNESGTTAAFSPPAGSWLVCAISGNPNSGGQTPSWVTPTNTGTALTWTQIAAINNASGGGGAVYMAYNASAQTNITVTAQVNWSGTALGVAGMFVKVLAGAKVSQAGAATPVTGTSTAQTNNRSITPTGPASLILLLGVDWSAGGVPTSSDTIDPYNNAGEISGGLVSKTGTTAGAAVSLNFVTGGAAPVNSFIEIEVLAP